MKIALINDRRPPVVKYGGTERVVTWLAQELIRQRHEVTVIAPAGSRIPGARMIHADRKEEAWARLPDDVDIVHFHGWLPEAPLQRPYVATLHGNLAPGEKLACANVICISRNHALRHGRQTFVYNGLPAEEYQFGSDKKEALLFFSKVRRRSKGCYRALMLARQFGFRLDVAGGTRLDLIKVGGLLTSLHPRYRFHGEVGGARKQALFAQAQALLFPIEWEEPFGLVVVEAMLSGTPVLATPRGAMPELVKPGESGFLFESDADFGQALASLPDLSPQRCRDYAAAHFSIQRCAEGYLEQYQRVLDGERLR